MKMLWVGRPFVRTPALVGLDVRQTAHGRTTRVKKKSLLSLSSRNATVSATILEPTLESPPRPRHRGVLHHDHAAAPTPPRRVLFPPSQAKPSAGDTGGDGAHAPPLVLVLVVLACRRLPPLRPRQLESTGHDLPRIAKHMFHRYVASVSYVYCKVDRDVAYIC